MVLELLLFHKRKLIYNTNFYHQEIQDQVFSTNVPKKCLLLLQINAADY